MKKSILSLLTMFALATTLAADAESLSGKWQVHFSIAGNDNDQNCTFTQKDEALSGSCTNSDKTTVEISGAVDGKKVSWSYKSEYNGSPLTVKFAGTVDSETQIKGTVTVQEFSVDGDFTATQVK